MYLTLYVLELLLGPKFHVTCGPQDISTFVRHPHVTKGRVRNHEENVRDSPKSHRKWLSQRRRGEAPGTEAALHGMIDNISP